MSDSLPPLSAEWSPYEEPFHEIARVVTMSPGFVLIPVAIPGPDLGRALAEWLSRAGHPVSVTQLQGDEDWERLAAFLMEQSPPSNGVVMVIGSDRPPQGYAAALGLVNQVRDALVKKLNCPLLWCGPREFLNLTWENAPDFWSIRAVDHTIEVRTKVLVSPDIMASLLRSASVQRAGRSIQTGMDAEALESLMYAALDQGDMESAATLARRLVADAIDAGRHEDAGRILDEMFSRSESLSTSDQWSFLLLRANMLILSERAEEAQAVMDQVLQDESIAPRLKAFAAFLWGVSAIQRREFEQARVQLEQAYLLALDSGSIKLSVRVRFALVTACLFSNRAEAASEWLSSAMADVNRMGDPDLAALARQPLAQLLSWNHDVGAALRTVSIGSTPQASSSGTGLPPLCLVVSSPKDPRPLRQLRGHATRLLREGRMRWWSRDNLLPLEDPVVAFEQRAREAALVVMLVSDDLLTHAENDKAFQTVRRLGIPILVLKAYSKDNGAAFPADVTVMRFGDNPSPDSPLPDPDRAWTEVIEDIERLLPPVPPYRSDT